MITHIPNFIKGGCLNIFSFRLRFVQPLYTFLLEKFWLGDLARLGIFLQF